MCFPLIPRLQRVKEFVVQAWNSHSRLLLWTVARLLAVAMLLTLCQQQHRSETQSAVGRVTLWCNKITYCRAEWQYIFLRRHGDTCSASTSPKTVTVTEGRSHNGRMSPHFSVAFCLMFEGRSASSLKGDRGERSRYVASSRSRPIRSTLISLSDVICWLSPHG